MHAGSWLYRRKPVLLRSLVHSQARRRQSVPHNDAIVATSVRADYDSTAATIPGCPASHSTAAAVVRDTGAVAHGDVSFSLIFE
jgi:hypothetical protein